MSKKDQLNSLSQSESSTVCFSLGMVSITVKEAIWVFLIAGFMLD